VGSSKAGSILRAKYLDWCSARIAERFLAMSPEELYERAEQASHGAAIQATPKATLSPSEDVSAFNAPRDWHAAIDQAVTAVADPSYSEATTFRAVIARVTELLADEMELPTFEEWSAAYSEAPEEFDRDMLGFWKEGLSD
jgi:hypothetical protein